MIPNEEVVDVFVKLGLTQLQAKTYFTLAKLGVAEARDISRQANIARQDIYRIMPTLQELGLAEKMISNPVTFKATPWKKGMSKLLEKKKLQQEELEKRTKAIFEAIADNNVSSEKYKGSLFVITSEKNLFLNKMDNAILETQATKDVILPYDSFKIMLFHNLESMKKAQKKGVKFRIITEKTKELPEAAQPLKSNPLYELRCVSDSIPVSLAIYDSKESNICISNETFVPSLWTNNSSIVKLAEFYFEEMWKKAKPVKIA